jgi:SAM-dependent methyltransferase
MSLPITYQQKEATRSSLFRLKLPKPLRRLLFPAWFGITSRTTGLSRSYGFCRGVPVDRHYIEQFLSSYRDDIKGRVIEIFDTAYTDKFGAGVTRRDVLDVDPANPLTTYVADLAAADAVPSDSFDCFVLTQTLLLIYDVHAAVRHVHRVLKPGGVVLVTVPTVSPIIHEVGPEHDYWRFTAGACRRLFGDVFGPENVQVHSYGNLLTAVASLSGMAVEDVDRRKLDVNDPHFPLIIGVRAVKRA